MYDIESEDNNPVYVLIHNDDGAGTCNVRFAAFNNEQEMLNADHNYSVFFKGTEQGFERHVAKQFGNKNTQHECWTSWIKSRMI